MGTYARLNVRVVNGSCTATHNLRANAQNSKLKKNYYTQSEGPKWQLSLPSLNNVVHLRCCHYRL